ncbi:MAG: hypothetical protein JOY72_09610 [Actinobacteria bacterium]|nr:hypothetical protein [Actinomycetota bacterium]MBV8480547.1 hypothetical protein [Actinomycetota bacterium]MBV8597552.1 hypothetical protein [Actinomycetota bacterium]
MKRSPSVAGASKSTTPVGVVVHSCARQLALRTPTRAGMMMAKPFANSSTWTRATGEPRCAHGACIAGRGW